MVLENGMLPRDLPKTSRDDSLAISCLQRDFIPMRNGWNWYAKKWKLNSLFSHCGSDEQRWWPMPFLLDGIQEDGKVHVNWGWGKVWSEWFDIDVLRPNITGFTGEGALSTLVKVWF